MLGRLHPFFGAVARPPLAVPPQPSQRRTPQQLAAVALAEPLGVTEIGLRIERQLAVEIVIAAEFIVAIIRRFGIIAAAASVFAPLPVQQIVPPANLPFGRMRFFLLQIRRTRQRRA